MESNRLRHMKYQRTLSVGGLLLALLLYAGGVVFGQGWRAIKPLKSVRTEVESLFGPSSDPHLASYPLPDGTLFVQYSTGPCTPEMKGGWNVPEGTAVLIRFVPKLKKRFTSLKLDFSKFRRVEGGDVVGVVNYTNEEEGVTYEVQRGRVDAIEYLPAKRDHSLKCPDKH
jgi:hypothetical protein